MTEIATPVPTSLPLARSVEAATHAATPVAEGSAPARPSRWRRLASAVADTHRAAVPF